MSRDISIRVRTMLLGIAGLMTTACSPSEVSRGWECIAPANAGGGWDLTCRSVGRAGSLGPRARTRPGADD